MTIGFELEGDIDEAVRALEKKGIRFDGAANRAKAGAFTGFKDPDGNQLYLAQLKLGSCKPGRRPVHTCVISW